VESFIASNQSLKFNVGLKDVFLKLEAPLFGLEGDSITIAQLILFVFKNAQRFLIHLLGGCHASLLLFVT
jgi:hypothetical protein